MVAVFVIMVTDFWKRHTQTPGLCGGLLLLPARLIWRAVFHEKHVQTQGKKGIKTERIGNRYQQRKGAKQTKRDIRLSGAGCQKRRLKPSFTHTLQIVALPCLSAPRMLTSFSASLGSCSLEHASTDSLVLPIHKVPLMRVDGLQTRRAFSILGTWASSPAPAA